MTSVISQALFHPAVSQGLKYGATTLGRDKAYRAIQYFARFLAWYLLTKGDKIEAARWTALKAHLGMARKLMRLGKPLEHLQAALRASISPGPAAETITTVARQIGYFGYLTYDAVVWANSIKLINLTPKTAKRIGKTSFRFWFAGIVFSIVNSVLRTSRLTRETKRLEASKSWGEKDLSEEAARETRLVTLNAARRATRQQFIVDLLDVWIPATGAEILNVSEGLLGIFGLISSLIGVKAQWNTVNGKK
ncbi:peroxisomal biogenesis factor 11 [Cyathus striatus]|nr:peroxisomal biogenesis factor 11 [Cyathus striatus]